MSRQLRPFAVAAILMLVFCQISAQMVRNPKLSSKDLDTAQAKSRQAGGEKAELIYAARLDLIQKGNYDSLIVVYAKPAKAGKDFYAMVVQEGKSFPLVYDKQGRALKSGDKFLRIGLKHEEGKAPLLRLMGSTIDQTKGEQQRNLDFRFNGTEFKLESESMTPVAR